jgi:propane monooxygenase coupling protein
MSDTRFKVDRTSSNRAGVTLMNNQVGHTVADVMRRHDNVSVEDLPSMIRVDGVGQFDFDYAEIAEALGWGRLRQRRLRGDHVDPLRAHGRPRRPRDHVRQPRDAAEYIDFDLKPVG